MVGIHPRRCVTSLHAAGRSRCISRTKDNFFFLTWRIIGSLNHQLFTFTRLSSALVQLQPKVTWRCMTYHSNLQLIQKFPAEVSTSKSNFFICSSVSRIFLLLCNLQNYQIHKQSCRHNCTSLKEDLVPLLLLVFDIHGDKCFCIDNSL